MRHSRTVLVLLAILLSAAVAAQEIQGEMATEDYLLLLGQINPAARDGAQRYSVAYQTKCGRALSTSELRRAVAAGSGDPVLMDAIRASYAKDEKTLAGLPARILCQRP
jgi:hypothetical protein